MMFRTVESYWRGRKVGMASMHRKELVLAPIFRETFDWQLETSQDINTDSLGTFTGEIPRVKGPIDTLRDKCYLVLSQNNIDACIGTEGSFGYHPEAAFIPLHQELIMYVDLYWGFEVVHAMQTTQTNFSGREIRELEELKAFAAMVQFGENGLILSDQETNPQVVLKGLSSHSELFDGAERIMREYGRLFVQTDMRAMYNKPRMELIKKLGWALANRLKRRCEGCGTPGFGEESFISGLPCSQCLLPTKSPLSKLEICPSCGLTQSILYPNFKMKEDPMYCNFCNP